MVDILSRTDSRLTVDHSPGCNGRGKCPDAIQAHPICSSLSIGQNSFVNAPVFVNFYILVTATHVDYTSALTALSRAIRFFQYRNVFTQDNVDPDSITTASVNIPAADRLDSFKLIFELYSPSMEEVNHLWGTLGGKQYPFVMYVLRMLDLRYYAVQSEGGLITNVIKEFRHKDPLAT